MSEEEKIAERVRQAQDWDRFSTMVALTLDHHEKKIADDRKQVDNHIQSDSDFKIEVVQRITKLETYTKIRVRLSIALSGAIPSLAIGIWKLIDYLSKK